MCNCVAYTRTFCGHPSVQSAVNVADNAAVQTRLWNCNLDKIRLSKSVRTLGNDRLSYRKNVIQTTVCRWKLCWRILFSYRNAFKWLNIMLALFYIVYQRTLIYNNNIYSYCVHVYSISIKPFWNFRIKSLKKVKMIEHYEKNTFPKRRLCVMHKGLRKLTLTSLV